MPTGPIAKWVKGKCHRDNTIPSLSSGRRKVKSLLIYPSLHQLISEKMLQQFSIGDNKRWQTLRGARPCPDSSGSAA